MVRNSNISRMEQTFYDDLSFAQKDFNSLKRTMTLDLNNRTGKKMKLSLDTPSSGILSSPDLVKLKLPTPELEKWLVEQQTLTTPTPTQIFFPMKAVTEEQEIYAHGFVEALKELQHSDSSQGTYSETQKNYSNLEPQYTTFSYLNSVEDSVTIKDEPQTVPNINSPPMSPIDMESQEKIKLERKRQRNRVAASKCRKRKLERIALLEEKVKVLKGENSELAVHVNRLKEQVYQLKQQVMEHAKSGCNISVIPGHL